MTIDPPRLAWRLPAATAGADAERTDHELASIEGTATLVRGRQLVVACDIRGLRSGEPATLTVTPVREDGTIATIWQKVKVAGHAETVLEAARKLAA